MKYLRFTIVALILVLAVCLFQTPEAKAATVASGTCGAEGSNLTWTLSDQGVCTVSGSGAMADYGFNDNTAPWAQYRTSIKKVVINKGVTYIGQCAFVYCSNLTSVSFPNSLTGIGTYAFSCCSSLAGISLPDSALDVNRYCFSQTAWEKNLPDGLVYLGKLALFYKGTCPETVTVKSGTLKIADSAFSLCRNLTTVYLPDSVTQIGNNAFPDLTKLSTVTIPNCLTSIGDGAFSGTALQSVLLPDSVVQIGMGAFDSTPWYENQPDGWVYAGKVLYTYKGSLPITITEATIKPGTIGIADGAFSNCSNLKSIDIPDSVTCIGKSAFFCLYELESVTIGSGVAYIGQWAFRCALAEPAVTFKGSAPEIHPEAFLETTATAFFPDDDPTWTASVRQNYGGSITWIPNEQAEEPEPALFEIDVARMILGNSLEFQFGVAKSRFTDLSGIYARIKRVAANGDVYLYFIPAVAWQEAGPYYAIVYDDLAAKEMADTFYVTILDKNGQPLSHTRTDSVRDYVARAFSGQTSAGKTMLVDMLNYGAAAQLHFNYNTGDLASSQLTAAQKAWGTKTAVPTENKRITGTNYMGTRLVLEGRIQMQIGFSGMDRSMYAVYSYTDHSGTVRSVTVNGKDFAEIDAAFGIELSSLVYADARTLVTVQIYNSDGKLLSTVKDSIESYVNRSGADSPLFDALMKFADSAKVYLHQ